MPEYIEREALCKVVSKSKNENLHRSPMLRWNHQDEHDRFLRMIQRAPAADVAPVVHGRWITPTKINGKNFPVPHCSVCEEVPCGVDENTNFCPNCGAKMDLEVQHEH